MYVFNIMPVHLHKFQELFNSIDYEKVKRVILLISFPTVYLCKFQRLERTSI